MEAVNNLKYIVYCTTNLINNKIYIGVHKTYTTKFDGYLGCGVYVNKPHSYNQSKTIFQRAVKKYGPRNFKRITIAEFTNEEDAMSLEEFLVNDEFLARNDVYNMILGGYGNKNMKKQIKCCCYTLEGKFIKEFESIRAAGRIQAKTEYSYNSISNAIIDKVSYLNMYWALEKVDNLDISQYSENRRYKKKVYQYKNTGEYETEYESIAEACKTINTCASSLDKACKLGYLSKNKYFSYIKMDQFSNAKLEYLKNLPIHYYDMNGNYVKTYKNELEAKKDLKIKGSIMKALLLKSPHNNKYQFSFEFVDKMCNRLAGEKPTTAKKIDQYDLNSNFIRTWDSIRECSKKLGITSNLITRVLNGTQTQTNGFIFKKHKVKEIV